MVSLIIKRLGLSALLILTTTAVWANDLSKEEKMIDIDYQEKKDQVTFQVDNADVNEVLSALSQTTGIEIVGSVKKNKASFSFEGQSVESVLDQILSEHNVAKSFLPSTEGGQVLVQVTLMNAADDYQSLSNLLQYVDNANQFDELSDEQQLAIETKLEKRAERWSQRMENVPEQYAAAYQQQVEWLAQKQVKRDIKRTLQKHATAKQSRDPLTDKVAVSQEKTTDDNIASLSVEEPNWGPAPNLMPRIQH